MGWSVPRVAAPQKNAAWSPWVVVFIFVLGYALALGWVVTDTPASGLYPLTSGHYLPVTGFTLVGILLALSLYHLAWEIDALRYFNTRHWQANTDAAWQTWAHQSLHVVKSIHCSVEADLLQRIAGLSSSSGEKDAPDVLLFPDDPAPPGIYRFEAISRRLLTLLQEGVYSLNLSRQAKIKLYVQTHTVIADSHLRYLNDLWQELFPSISVQVDPIAADAPLGCWSACVDAQAVSVILAMHYYDGIDENPINEIAAALLLSPPALLKPAERKTSPRLFRAMPVKVSQLPAELTELRDMTQQPTGSLRLVWFSGLTGGVRQKLSALAHELKLPLRQDAPMGGLLDVDKDNAQYGALSGWLLAGAAAHMVEQGQGSQWILCADGSQTWAMVVGNQAPVLQTPAEDLPDEPYPAGSVTLALLFNIVLFWSLGHAWPQWLFSGWGLAAVMLSMLITFPGSVFALRGLVSALQKSHFIKAANASVRDQ